MPALDIPPTRHSLLARAGGGDRDAVGSLFGLYAPVIRGWCRRFPGVGEADAEDLTSEVFLALEGVLRAYRREYGRFRDYLRGVVRHRVMDELRGRYRRPQLPGPVLDDVAAEHAVDALCDAVDAARAARARLVEEAVRRVRARVKGTTWLSFEYRHWHALPSKEVAERLGVSAGSVDQNYHRCREYLRREIESLLAAPPGEPQ